MLAAGQSQLEELDQAVASVPANMALSMERIERRRWQERIDSASKLKAVEALARNRKIIFNRTASAEGP
jgi:hypothetical protein